MLLRLYQNADTPRISEKAAGRFVYCYDMLPMLIRNFFNGKIILFAAFRQVN